MSCFSFFSKHRKIGLDLENERAARTANEETIAKMGVTQTKLEAEIQNLRVALDTQGRKQTELRLQAENEAARAAAEISRLEHMCNSAKAEVEQVN